LKYQRSKTSDCKDIWITKLTVTLIKKEESWEKIKNQKNYEEEGEKED